MTNRKRVGGAGIAVALTMAFAATARADEAADKARLEQRVQELESELAEVKSTLRGGYFTANSDLEARVAELERDAGDNTMAGSFKNGLSHQTADGAFRVQWFGLIQNDWVWWVDDGDRDTRAAVGDQLNPGTEFRRVRLGAKGQMYGNVRWSSELELSDNDVQLADVWMELATGDFGNLRVGHMKEPIGFDQLTNDKYLQFMERSFVERLSPVRNTGVMLHGLAMDDRMLYQVGAFRDAGTDGDDTNNENTGEVNFSGRLSTRPMVEDDGTTWLHLGASARYSDIPGERVTGTLGGTDLFVVTARPANGQAPDFLGVGGEADTALQLGLEAAYARGPWTFLGEFGAKEFDLENGKDSMVRAWSVEGGYWLTGENTPYDKETGTFGRTSPKHNFGDGDGQGAWQVALRYDGISMDDGDFDAGDMSQWTAALRWWLNPNSAIMLNVARADTNDQAGEIDNVMLVGVRFQLDF